MRTACEHCERQLPRTSRRLGENGADTHGRQSRLAPANQRPGDQIRVRRQLSQAVLAFAEARNVRSPAAAAAVVLQAVSKLRQHKAASDTAARS